GSGGGSRRGCGLAALRLLVLGAEPVRDDLLLAAFLAAGLEARLGQLAVLPLVVVEEAIALCLVGALAALNLTLQAFLALGLWGGLAALRGRLCHRGMLLERKGAGFYRIPPRINSGTDSDHC